MNIINKLTIRQLKLNKKRTLVTIIGTIISAAMITAVATLGLSFTDLFQRQAIASDGEWHVVYEDVNKAQIEAINADNETKITILSRDVGYAILKGSKNNNKPYLYVKEFNKAGFKNFPIELSEGRLPEKSDEIVISEAIISNAKVELKIGDTLDLAIGQRYLLKGDGNSQVLLLNASLQREEDTLGEYLKEDSTKSYIIVGIIKRPTWEYTWSPGYTVLSYVDEDSLASVETVNAYVIVKHIDNTMFQHADNVGTKNGIKSYNFNNSLLRYYGVVKDDSVRSFLFVLSGIIMIIIMIGSISLIYNAFAISVSERSRYLGMLSSVGATKRQKRNSVFFEGAVIGAISIPVGILSGYIGIGITFLCINPMILGALGITESLRLTIYPSALIVSVMVSISTILISSYIPARRASNISAIDAIRQTADVKFTKKAVRTSKITRKLFGIEGDLGLKNLKRNKGRYKATVFSLIISMVLFLVVSAFTIYLKKSVSMTQEGINFDIQASIESENGKGKENIIKKITSLEDITKVIQIETIETTAWIKEALIADYLKDSSEGIMEEGKYPYQATWNVIDSEALQNYAKEVGVDYLRLTDTEKPAIIVIDTVRYKDNKKDKYVETKVIKTSVGEKLDCYFNNPETNQVEALRPVEVVALTNILPMGIMSLGESPNFHIILSKEVFDFITEGKPSVLDSIDTRLYLNSNNPLKLQESVEAVQNEVGGSNLNVYNVFLYRQREEQIILLISVFFYAFILLITSICVANIINTISTSITLRKREFAMLKSVGITPKGFNKMLNYESIFYGVKTLVYGLPISFAAMYLIYGVLLTQFDFAFTVPWTSVGIAVASVFIIVGMSMLYSSRKVKRENIIDALKQEII